MFNLSEKGRGIRAMFDDIAPRYDLLNRLLSFGIDRRWRRYAVGQLDIPPGGGYWILPPVPEMWLLRLLPALLIRYRLSVKT